MEKSIVNPISHFRVAWPLNGFIPARSAAVWFVGIARPFSVVPELSAADFGSKSREKWKTRVIYIIM